MNCIHKKDVMFTGIYLLFIISIGFLCYGEAAEDFYIFKATDEIKSILQILYMLLWLLPNFLILIYLVNETIQTYESSYAYYKVRSGNQNLWMRVISKQISIKVFDIVICKAICIYFFTKEWMPACAIYEAFEVFVMAMLALSAYLLIPNMKIIAIMILTIICFYIIVLYCGIGDEFPFLFFVDISYLHIPVIGSIAYLSYRSTKYLLQHRIYGEWR